MNRIFDFSGYVLFRLLVIFISIIPFRVLYIFSDITRFVLFHIIPYRKKVIITNLRNSFPEKSDTEIMQICRNFYKNLSDIAYESIKGMSLSKKQILKRHKIINIDIIDPHFAKKESVIGVTAHYANWEWGAFSAGIYLKHNAIAFYKPLSNRFTDHYMRKRRAKFNCTLANISETNKTFAENVNKPSAFIMAADQSPLKLENCYWIEFLNQDTACLHGPEKYANMHNLPVYYIDIQRVKRGYYELTLTLLTQNPGEMEPGKLTENYMRMLESKIKYNPENWLWSHKRWKRKRKKNGFQL